MNSQALSDRVKTFPDKPGIYQFVDKNNKVIYIGKAKNLKKRVQSYFSSKISLSRKTTVLVSKVEEINYTVVDSESEALLLENVFIKEYKPKYNILLKDDKTYPWINIKNEPFPRVVLTRNFVNNGSKYFGPFSSTLLARTMLDLIKKLYPLRTCNYNLSEKNILSGKLKPCLELHIGNCHGPCVSMQDKKDYSENIKAIIAILKGNILEVIVWLKENMKRASEALDFEKANTLKLKIEILEKYRSKSAVTGIKTIDVEVYNYFIKNDFIIVNFLRVYRGAIIQTYTLDVKKNLDEEISEILSSLIIEIRKRVRSSTKTIIVPIDIEFKLKELTYIIPQRGEKKKLLDLSLKNCIIYSQEIEKRELRKSNTPIFLVEAIQKELGLQVPPLNIECFDNSNLQGTNPSSSCVVFKNGKASKKEYRHFNVKTVVGIDDYATMREIVYRRFKRMIAENTSLPQLIVIDGGRGQLNAAQDGLKELGIYGEIEICGIAKRNEELFFPLKQKAIVLDKNSKALRLLQQIRDEAHRFGLKHHRNRRSKGLNKTVLEQIDGIGKETVRKIYLHYKSVDEMINDTPDNLIKIAGKEKALKILLFFKSKTD